MTDTKPTLIRDMNDYLHGYCHIYGLALAIAVDCQITLIWDIEAIDGDLNPANTPCLVHASVKLPDGRLADAECIHGDMATDYLFEIYPCNTPIFQDVSPDELIHIIHDKKWETIDWREVFTLCNTILREVHVEELFSKSINIIAKLSQLEALDKSLK